MDILGYWYLLSRAIVQLSSANTAQTTGELYNAYRNIMAAAEFDLKCLVYG